MTEASNQSSENSRMRLRLPQLGDSLEEVLQLVIWIMDDPVRPSLKKAATPIAALFTSAFLQGVSFAIAIGYLSLSTTDWNFDAGQFVSALPEFLQSQLSFLADRVIDMSPTGTVILAVVGGFAVIYAGHALLAAWGTSRLLDLGYRYQSAAARRLFSVYSQQLADGAQRIRSGDGVDSRLLISMANSEARYLGRGLTTVFTSFNSLISLIIGLFLVSRTDPFVVFGGLVFVAGALALQMIVMSFALKASRDLVKMSGPNAVALAKIAQSVTVSPAAFDVSRDDINDAMTQHGAIYDYDMAYQRRLKIGVLSQLFTNLAFICALILLLVYLINGVSGGTVTPAAAFANIVIYRFIFGGAAGLLGGFVSFVSFKPYFDNYISYIAHEKEVANSGKKQNTPITHITFIGPNGLRVPFYEGEWIAVAVKDGVFSWRTILDVLDHCISDATWAHFDAARDVVAVTNEYPLLKGDLLRSAGLSIDTDWNHARSILKSLIDDIDAAQSIIENKKGLSPEEAWSLLTPRLFVVLGLVNAVTSKARIIYANEGGLRTLAERERKDLAECLKDFRMIIHYPDLPTYSMLPRPMRLFVVTDEGPIGELDPACAENIPTDLREKFESSGKKGNHSLFMEEM